MTFWSPNVNIFRDPRWGRGQETPGEDPYLTAEYARMHIKGLQGDEREVGFVKISACCKHFAAHSIEEDRYSFDAVVSEQDLADTYLPAFKACVENNVTSIMTAYSAINGIPATSHKHYITDVIRGQWGFDGYIVSDCGAVNNVIYDHKYTATESETCYEVLNAGVDVECGLYGSFFSEFLLGAFNEGLVTESMIDTALTRGFLVLMRLGYFEKLDSRPYKDLQAEDVDSVFHNQLSLDAAHRSIVLLKNMPNEMTGVPPLPLNPHDFDGSRTSLSLIGPHVNGSEVFLGNYHGLPSGIKVPLDEIRNYVPVLEWEQGCDVESFDGGNFDDAVDLARRSTQVVLFVGLDSAIEAEYGDRPNITFTGLQSQLIRRVLDVAQQPVIMFVVSGGVVDLSEYKNDPRVGAIVWAGYIGQNAGQAIADVLFGNYNPSGRLTQTFYENSYVNQVSIQDMNMRPIFGSPGRTYRFFTGEPVYPFGYGLSYTSFEYTFPSQNQIQISHLANVCTNVTLNVVNVGQRTGDHSVLWFLAPPNAGLSGRPIKRLVDFEKIHNTLPFQPRESRICLRSDTFKLANDKGEFEVVLGEWVLMVGDLTRSIFVT